jgi:(5-formylfuran-3-yl)methyl phosphate synthase
LTALLASVRTLEEAALAVEAGADIIDLKEPQDGALGALPLPLINAIVAQVRRLGSQPVSATIGDLADGEIDEMARRVLATVQTGVDFVKVGIVHGPHERLALAKMADLPARVVPLFLADDGLDLALIEYACSAGFPVVMVDTADKRAGSLFDCVEFDTLRQMIARVRGAGAHAGLAGSLRVEHLPLLRALKPAIAGFRGALCEDSRTGRLVADKVRALRVALPAISASDLGEMAGRVG